MHQEKRSSHRYHSTYPFPWPFSFTIHRLLLRFPLALQQYGVRCRGSITGVLRKSIRRNEESQCLENNNDELSMDKFPFSRQVLHVVGMAMTKSSGFAFVLAQTIGTKSCKAKPMPHFRSALAVSFNHFPHVR